ncbi:MAG TPA: FtsX-like permease family protein [Caulobacteraceae bacterium]|nr:FtsX-like permease family protein [Caulobacteraceae bacterium]
MLLTLAWRNLWRRPSRTWLSVASMAIAAALLTFMLSFQLGVYDTMKASALRLFDGYAQLQPTGYADDPDIAKVLPDAARLAARAAAIPGVSAAAPRGAAYVVLAHGADSYGAAIEGVEPTAEAKVSTLHATIRQGRYLRAGDGAAAIMGDVFARNLGLEVGDSFTLLGAGADGSLAADRLKLVGVFHTGVAELDRQLAEMPLARFRDDFDLGAGANLIALAGPSLSAVNADLPRLRALAAGRGASVQDWGALQPGLKQAITLDFSIGLLWYASLVVVVVFIILNTLLMSVLERTHEFGALLALGMRSDLIGRVLWLELLLLSLLGAGLGVLVGGAVAAWLQSAGIAVGQLEGLLAQWGMPGRLYPHVSAISLLAGPLAIVVSVAVGGFVPYLRIRRLEPLAAMAAP